MSVLGWFEGKEGPEYETARWVHDQIEDRIRANDVVGLAELCVAIKPIKGVFCGIMLAGFLGRDEVVKDAFEELQAAVRTMPDEICERVFAIIERGHLPIHLAKRRGQYEDMRDRQRDAAIEAIRAQLATCSATQLAQATTALLGKQPTIFDVPLSPTLLARADLAELGLARLRELLPALPDDECLEVIDLIHKGRLGIETRAKADEIRARQQRAALASDAGSEPRNPALEAALTGDFDDANGYAVLGDFLQRHGHPRGELIALQLRAETEPALAVEAQAYLAQHADAILGSLAAHQQTQESEPRPALTWRRGFIDRIAIAIEYLVQSDDWNHAQLLQRVLMHPAGRLIRGIDVTSSGHSGRIDDLIEVIAKHRPACLREVVLDVWQRDQGSEAGSIAALWNVPSLRSVRMRGAMVDVGTIAHPLLEHAVFDGAEMPAATLRAIARAAWPRIERLAIGVGRRNPIALDDVQLLLSRRDLPALVELGLYDGDSTNDICRAVVASPLAAQLRELDLSFGTMTDLGARTLADNARSLPHLEKLIVSDNALSPVGVAVLQAAFRNVEADDQADPDDDDDDDYDV